MFQWLGKFGVAVFLLLLISCASSSYHAGDEVTRADLKQWAMELKRNPNNSELLSEVAAYFFEVGEYKKSWGLLKRAFAINPNSPQTLYYIGRHYERQNKLDQALKIYARYTRFSPLADYRKEMEGRYRIVTRQKMKATMRMMVQNEALLDIPRTAPSTIAVLPLNYLGMDEQYAPIGKGLAEMIITDLNQVKSIRTVERIRVQSIMDEVNLQQTGLTNPSSQMTISKLLGAGKLINGNFDVSKGDKFHLDVVFGDILQQTFSDPIAMNDVLKNLFLLEKQLVFQVIDDMNIRLTPEEKENIQRIPTKSIQAFLAYSMGLEMEDQGNFDQAVDYFRHALMIDPNFLLAMEQEQINQVMVLGEHPRHTWELKVAGKTRGNMEQPVSAVNMKQAMINNRMTQVNSHIGSRFYGSIQSSSFEEDQVTTRVSLDTRAGTEEISSAIDQVEWPDLEGLNDLPEPPDPPEMR